jgi:hypothetical protein
LRPHRVPAAARAKIAERCLLFMIRASVKFGKNPSSI